VTVGEKIGRARSYARPALKQETLAQALGLATSTVGKWESGAQGPPYNHVVAIARITNIPIEWFYDEKDTAPPVVGPTLPGPDSSSNTPKNDPGPRSLAGTPLKPIPVAGVVSAGPGETNVDTDKRPLYVPESLERIGGVGYTITGDSMVGGPDPSKDLYPGDIGIFREDSVPRPRYTFLVKANDGGFRVKTLRQEVGGERKWVLVSRNPDIPDEPLGDNQLLGFLVGFYRTKGTYEKIEGDPSGLILD
jgi:transcriptional regulator with XRE-family HTH domain